MDCLRARRISEPRECQRQHKPQKWQPGCNRWCSNSTIAQYRQINVNTIPVIFFTIFTVSNLVLFSVLNWGHCAVLKSVIFASEIVP